MLATLFAARWLGHGRATECYLAVVAALYGLQLLVIPDAAYASRATVDIAPDYGHLLGVPFLVMAALSGVGLTLNIAGRPYSRILRFAGAFLGTMIWIWLTAKFVMIDVVATVGLPFCLASIAFSIRIMAMAMAGLPAPAAPGKL